MLQGYGRPLEDCLQLDWPHALGHDERGLLVWRTRELAATWEDILTKLAEIKIALRTALPAHPGMQSRHLLALPITHHPVETTPKTGKIDRLANQLRFKIHKVREGNQASTLVAFSTYHTGFRKSCGAGSQMAHLLQKEWVRAEEVDLWPEVHKILDDCAGFSRVGS